MNKNYLILGGSVAGALVTGSAGGYFLAKRKYQNLAETRVSEEVSKTKEYYELLLEKAESTTVIQSDSSAAEVMATEEEEEPAEEELTAADRAAIEKGRRSLADASRALVDYRGLSNKIMEEDKPPLDQVVQNNIFTNPASASKPALPPRDPTTGKFQSKKDGDPPTKAQPELTPYIIEHEVFLLNEPEHHQENLKWFANDKTLIQVYDNEPVDIERVGEVHLTLFPEVGPHEPSIICVRNEGLGMDYEILWTDESLTEFMGLGETDPAEEEDDDLEEEEEEDDDRVNFADRPRSGHPG